MYSSSLQPLLLVAKKIRGIKYGALGSENIHIESISSVSKSYNCDNGAVSTRNLELRKKNNRKSCELWRVRRDIKSRGQWTLEHGEKTGVTADVSIPGDQRPRNTVLTTTRGPSQYLGTTGR
ncbi:hypothetical protein J6590_051265 [Homalodisca vitripennis]|nr:hypothetical protein J6590_051265 [Homalodisca vitripennis]